MSPLRILWTLCLALILPLGQVAAGAHELTHLQQRTEAPAKGLQANHCDICGIAAAVTGGGAPSKVPAVALLQFAHEQRPSAAVSVALLPPPRYFPARAPPVSLQ